MRLPPFSPESWESQGEGAGLGHACSVPSGGGGSLPLRSQVLGWRLGRQARPLPRPQPAQPSPGQGLEFTCRAASRSPWRACQARQMPGSGRHSWLGCVPHTAGVASSHRWLPAEPADGWSSSVSVSQRPSQPRMRRAASVPHSGCKAAAPFRPKVCRSPGSSGTGQAGAGPLAQRPWQLTVENRLKEAQARDFWRPTVLGVADCRHAGARVGAAKPLVGASPGRAG